MDGFAGPLAFDTLANLVSGLGTSKDKSTAGRFVSRSMLTRSEIDALYHQNWLGGKIIDIPAEDTVREWRAWNATKPDVAALEAEEKRLGLRQKVQRAIRLSKKDGGSAILVGDGTDPAGPLNVAAMPRGGLQFLHVVSRWELSVEAMVRDPRSPWFGQAGAYRMFLPDATTVQIHPSRVIVFRGIERTDLESWTDPWGLSVYERLHDAVRDATASVQTAASMLQEAKIDVIRIPGLSANVHRDDYRTMVLQRFSLAMALKAVNNALILDEAETWEQKVLTLQGLPEIIRELLSIVAGAADIPVTRLLGKSPAGLNSTGKADLESYYTMVRSVQETNLRPTIEPLDEMLIRSALGGRRPRGLYYDWRPLWSLPATDEADVNHKGAMAVDALSRAGVFTPEALQIAVINQLEESGFLPGIADAVRQHPGAPGLTNRDTAPPQPPAATVPAARRPPSEEE